MDTITHPQEELTNIVLDLDETLIHSIELRDLTEEKRKEFESQYKCVEMDDEYLVVLRPHLEPFLNFVFSNFNVSIWTAASRSYALFILSNVVLKNGRKAHLFLHSKNCSMSKKEYGNLKDLRMLHECWKVDGYSHGNTIIIDDNKGVKSCQKKFCINVAPFDPFSEDGIHDSVLQDVQKGLMGIVGVSSEIDTKKEEVVKMPKKRGRKKKVLVDQ